MNNPLSIFFVCLAVVAVVLIQSLAKPQFTADAIKAAAENCTKVNKELAFRAVSSETTLGCK